MSKSIYEMKLHEIIYIQNGEAKVMRVAGGWIYTICRLDHDAMNSVFVPYAYQNEFPSGEGDLK